MTGAPSITRRLLVALTGLTVVLWIVASSLALYVMHDRLDASLDSSLQEAAQRLLTLAVENGLDHASAAKPGPEHDANIAEHTEYLTYQIRDIDGRVLLRSHDAPEQPYGAPLKTGFLNTDAHRIYTEGTASGTLFIQVAETHEHRHAAIVDAGLSLVVPLALLVPLSALATAFIVRQCMAPVLKVQQEISRRGSGNLTPIGSAGVVTELSPITTAVDRLIDRLRAALDSERTFTANSAHELRSPLASALAQLQRLAGTLEKPAQQERLRAIELELRRLIDLTEKLMQLSRAEAGMALASRTTDLRPFLELMIDDLRHAPRAAGRIELVVDPAARLVSRMDVDAFAIVVRNLIDNALLHGTASEPVRVSVGPGAQLSFVNAGPIVAATELKGLTRRFVRGTTEVGGVGLGLAIVETIVGQSGGRLELRSPASGRSDGFEAVVTLDAT
jgi:two-component system OmpR family sensor kinase